MPLAPGNVVNVLQWDTTSAIVGGVRHDRAASKTSCSVWFDTTLAPHGKRVCCPRTAPAHAERLAAGQAVSPPDEETWGSPHNCVLKGLLNWAQVQRRTVVRSGFSGTQRGGLKLLWTKTGFVQSSIYSTQDFFFLFFLLFFFFLFFSFLLGVATANNPPLSVSSFSLTLLPDYSL